MEGKDIPLPTPSLFPCPPLHRIYYTSSRIPPTERKLLLHKSIQENYVNRVSECAVCICACVRGQRSGCERAAPVTSLSRATSVAQRCDTRATPGLPSFVSKIRFQQVKPCPGHRLRSRLLTTSLSLPHTDPRGASDDVSGSPGKK